MAGHWQTPPFCSVKESAFDLTNKGQCAGRDSLHKEIHPIWARKCRCTCRMLLDRWPGCWSVNRRVHMRLFKGYGRKRDWGRKIPGRVMLQATSLTWDWVQKHTTGLPIRYTKPCVLNLYNQATCDSVQMFLRCASLPCRMHAAEGNPVMVVQESL